MVDIREQLREPLDQAALKQHPTKKFLTVINPTYVIERLNDVFGLGGWHATYEIVSTEGMIVAKCKLVVPGHTIAIEQYGGNDNSDLGDAYKGACTDALTKCASYLEIGIDVFKGGSHKEVAQKPAKTAPAAKPKKQELKEASEKEVALLTKLIKSHHIPEERRIEIEDQLAAGIYQEKCAFYIDKCQSAITRGREKEKIADEDVPDDLLLGKVTEKDIERIPF